MKTSTKLIYLSAFLLKLFIFSVFNVDFLKKLPFFSSTYQDFEKIEEGIYMFQNKFDPYEYPTMFQVYFHCDNNNF